MRLAFITICVFANFGLALADERPVIRLDDVYIEGNIRKPPLVEIQASDLDQKLQKAALSSLQRLEKRLLTPLSAEAFRNREKSGN